MLGILLGWIAAFLVVFLLPAGLLRIGIFELYITYNQKTPEESLALINRMPDFTKSIVSSSLEIHSAGPLEEHPERFEQITLLNAYSSIVISAILLTMWFVILIASIAQFDSFISVTISIFSSAITVWIMRDNLRFYGQLRQIDESGAEKQAD